MQVINFNRGNRDHITAREPLEGVENGTEASLVRESADSCVCCGSLIASDRQIHHPGTDVCGDCATPPGAA